MTHYVQHIIKPNCTIKDRLYNEIYAMCMFYAVCGNSLDRVIYSGIGDFLRYKDFFINYYINIFYYYLYGLKIKRKLREQFRLHRIKIDKSYLEEQISIVKNIIISEEKLAEIVKNYISVEEQ